MEKYDFVLFDKEWIVWSRVSVKVYNLIQSKKVSVTICYILDIKVKSEIMSDME